MVAVGDPATPCLLGQRDDLAQRPAAAAGDAGGVVVFDLDPSGTHLDPHGDAVDLHLRIDTLGWPALEQMAADSQRARLIAQVPGHVGYERRVDECRDDRG